jgi:DNA-binding sugar fermentation-stimulating protein
MNPVFKLPELKMATVIKRPSKTCKSPYVADILIDGENDITMAHAPALGCNGLCDKDARVLVTQLPVKKGAVCSYRIELAETKEGTIIGINPKLAEKIVEEYVMKSEMTKTYKREKTILNSRFDFVGTHADNNQNFVLEVKTVPLCVEPGKAFFPHGYRKKKGDAVSPRALKHLNDLIEISQNSNANAIMCYVIQRSDAHSFIPSDTDPIYKEKFYEAKEKGVSMKNLYLTWNKDGECFVRKYVDFT